MIGTERTVVSSDYNQYAQTARHTFCVVTETPDAWSSFRFRRDVVGTFVEGKKTNKNKSVKSLSGLIRLALSKKFGLSSSKLWPPLAVVTQGGGVKRRRS